MIIDKTIHQVEVKRVEQQFQSPTNMHRRTDVSGLLEQKAWEQYLKYEISLYQYNNICNRLRIFQI